MSDRDELIAGAEEIMADADRVSPVFPFPHRLAAEALVDAGWRPPPRVWPHGSTISVTWSRCCASRNGTTQFGEGAGGPMTDPLITQLDRVIVAIHSADDCAAYPEGSDG